ncbi:AAA family ATPase [Streptomyces sp. HPF1205]|uniref:AAA family ATPase n=1 Tax=Streptomyces sp. HPF1205 TaxID=2873262 RepID=UPI001CECF0A3|nr:SMC family ATPase [Streptomyces sp. HPF1205]
MRLHHLRITAFGPFATTQDVDFDELSAAGLFLLHGPTGAGKTSVLDAVCYALYGQVPGARPATRLRSDHAAAGTPTEVVLDLTVGGRRLEITRRPEQLRAKKRGTGLTHDKAVTLLREYDRGQWRGLSKSHQEIGEEIKQLVGMSCEQFCQVVLLPQGEFAAFLRASAIERAKLLGRLFDTRRFKAVEAWLRDRAAEAGRRLEAGDRELADLAARMRQAAGPGPGDRTDQYADPDPDPESGGAPDSGGWLLAWAAELRCEARERYEIARAAVTGAEHVHASAAEAATAARDLHALQARHAEARRRARILDQERPARTEARARLDRARRAAGVEPALALRGKAAERYEAAVAAERAAAAELVASGEPLPPAPAVAPTAAAGSGSGRATGPGSGPATGPGSGQGGGSGTGSGRTADSGSVQAAHSVSAAGPEPGRVIGSDQATGPGSGHAADSGPAAGSGPGRTAHSGRGQAAGPVSVAGSGQAAGSGPGPVGGPGPTLPHARRASSGNPPDGAIGPGGGIGGSGGGSGEDRATPEPGPAAPGGPDGSPRKTSAPDGFGGGFGEGRAPHAPGSAPPGLSVPAQGAPGRRAADVPPYLDADLLIRRARQAREELGGLARGEEGEARLRELGERLAAVEREERADEEAVQEAQTWLEAWPATRARLRARLDAAMEAAAQAAALAAEVSAAARRETAAGERDRLATESARAEDAVRDARDRTAAARERWQDVREARIDGIAAELARELADGEPCRVCGATEHPAPARPARRQVTRADEDGAHAEFQRESADLDLARETAARLTAALEAAVATAGEAPRAELAAAHAELARRHSAAVREAAGVPEARLALEGAEQERDRRTALRQEAVSRAAARASRREELTERYEQARSERDLARAGYADVAARRTALARRAALLERAATAARERADAQERLTEAEEAAVVAAAGAGFGSPEEAAAALLPADRRRAAEREAEEWARQEAAVAAELSAPGPAAAARRRPAEPEPAEAALAAATRALRDASAAESAAASRTAELDRLGALATARVRELAPARDGFARLKRLSDLAGATSAENTYRMELETYVLAARLEQVAAAAGARLRRMSSGRYTLAHSDARADRRAKSGLGLVVVDSWTGTERDTSTLSGGETFFASLALALGLADVVTDEAGGTRLDTLFIDEGFGSLDEQTLDEVLDVLDSLRERDRAVGIVSHVADLRHRIPAQLRVVKGRDGSTVRTRTATAIATPRA